MCDKLCIKSSSGIDCFFDNEDDRWPRIIKLYSQTKNLCCS